MPYKDPVVKIRCIMCGETPGGSGFFYGPDGVYYCDKPNCRRSFDEFKVIPKAAHADPRQFYKDYLAKKEPKEGGVKRQ